MYTVLGKAISFCWWKGLEDKCHWSSVQQKCDCLVKLVKGNHSKVGTGLGQNMDKISVHPISAEDWVKLC